jgi:hypothetical protein
VKIEVAWQLTDCWNAALEPNQAWWLDRAPGATGTVTARNGGAVSALPEVAETVSGIAVAAQRKKEWEKWQKRKSKTYGVLKMLIWLAIKLDLDDLNSTRDM